MAQFENNKENNCNGFHSSLALHVHNRGHLASTYIYACEGLYPSPLLILFTEERPRGTYFSNFSPFRFLFARLASLIDTCRLFIRLDRSICNNTVLNIFNKI